MALIDELRLLEELLLRRGPACDARCQELLAKDFREFGSSGKVFSREAVLAEVIDSSEKAYEIASLHCEALGSDCALLTYELEAAGRTTLRSSLWVYRSSRWQVLFHQGTISGQMPS